MSDVPHSAETVTATRPPQSLAPLRPRPQALDGMLQEPSPDKPLPFGRYQLMRRIGAGGMGEVFLAREQGPNPRACVVKKVLPNLVANRAFVGRFLDESKVVVRLKHQNIARVYAMGDVNGEYFLTMEYVQGKTVSRFTKRLRDQKLEMPLGLVLLICERVCEGLQYAHQATDEHGASLHLVHRDLSPANVCISYDGHVKIIDFGAAQSTLKNEQTAPRVVIGNLTYMAPEQAKKLPVDGRADVYSCGVMLWELLAWHALPQKGDPIERWRKAANPVWEPPSKSQPSVPRDIDELVMKALAKDPNERFASAATLAEALKKARQRHAPDVTERDLSELISRVFSNEKRAEDEMLSETVSGKTVGRRTTRVAVPVTAMAFEHTVILAPGDYQSAESADPAPLIKGPGPEEVTDPAKEPEADFTPTPATDPRRKHLTVAPTNTLRTSFGFTIRGAQEPVFERTMMREMEASIDSGDDDDSEEVTIAARGLPLWQRVVIFGGIFALAGSLGFLSVWLAMR